MYLQRSLPSSFEDDLIQVSLPLDCEHIYGTTSSASDGRSIGTAKSSCSRSTTSQTIRSVSSTNITIHFNTTKV